MSNPIYFEDYRKLGYRYCWFPGTFFVLPPQEQKLRKNV